MFHSDGAQADHRASASAGWRDGLEEVIGVVAVALVTIWLWSMDKLVSLLVISTGWNNGQSLVQVVFRSSESNRLTWSSHSRHQHGESPQSTYVLEPNDRMQGKGTGRPLCGF